MHNAIQTKLASKLFVVWVEGCVLWCFSKIFRSLGQACMLFDNTMSSKHGGKASQDIFILTDDQSTDLITT